MKNVTILPPEVGLLEEIAIRLHSEERNYSNTMIVFPGKRPAHVLRKMLAERHQSSYIPPRIFSIETFIELLHRELLGVHTKNLETADALSLLFDVHTEAHEKVGAEHFVSLDAFVPVGRQLFRELEAVALANLPLPRVKEVLSSVEFLKFHALSYYYENFYRRVVHNGYSTRATSYRTVAGKIGEINLEPFQQIIFAGFYAFTNTEKKIITNLLERENVSFIFQDGIGLLEQLQKSGISTNQQNLNHSTTQLLSAKGDCASDEHNSNTPSLHFIKAPDTHGQTFALAAELQKKIQEKSVDEKIAIVLPGSEALFPVFHHALSLIPEENYNIALGYPLVRTPAYGFINSLMELLGSAFHGKFSAKSYLKFVLHPYTKNIRFGKRSDVTRILFHSLEEHLLEHRSKALFTLEQIENDAEFFEETLERLASIGEEISSEQLRQHLCTIHNHTIRKLNEFSSIGEFARSAIEVLTFIFEHSTANLHPYFRPYVERLIEALGGLSNSLLAEKRFEEPLAYFTLVRSLIASESVPFSGTPLKGLQTLGLLETRNLKFDTLYILDANDDVLPGSRSEDVLLPQPVRKLLGLETARDREQLIEYYFTLAIHSAKEVHLFYTETEAGGKEKSRFVEKVLWKLQQRDGKVDLKSYEQVAKYHVRLANKKPEPIKKTTEMLRHLHQRIQFSSHSLDTYLKCQLRFYYQNVLRLRERSEASEDVDNVEIGNIVHSVLTEYFKPFEGKPIPTEHLTQKRLLKTLDEYFKQNFGEELTGTTFLLKRQIGTQLWQFIENYQVPLASNGKIVISGLEKPMSVEKNGYTFTGRIDRVELRGEHTYILDYKTGKDDTYVSIKRNKLNPEDSSTWGEAIQSFQLPMYMLLYNELTGKGIEKITPAYLFLGKKDIDESIEVGLGDDEISDAEVYRAVEPIIFNIIEEIFDVKNDFTPTDDLEKQCPHCPYRTMCGTEWVRGWRE
ncbi:MAG: PD-(D/E)XK nuclease family protein [Ignavibacteriae bacterium]|nr:PD-(D/E)XK nuclease family protein [Ignavibacteriota bacterium]